MHIATTVPTAAPSRSGELFADLERIGYDTGFSFEAKHDPFLPIALATQSTARLRLGTAVAIGFARNPMVLANVGYDLQEMSGGRFVLGLGSQIRPHIQNRFSEVWSQPAARMRELVLAVRAIWDCFEGGSDLRFDGDFYRHTLMTPAFNPGPNPYGPPPVFVGGFGPRMIEVAGEVADGLIVHPFNSRRSLEALVLPALARGRAIGDPGRGAGDRLGDDGRDLDHRRGTRDRAALGQGSVGVLRVDPRVRARPRDPRLRRTPPRPESPVEGRPVVGDGRTRSRRLRRGDCRGRAAPGDRAADRRRAPAASPIA